MDSLLVGDVLHANVLAYLMVRQYAGLSQLSEILTHKKMSCSIKKQTATQKKDIVSIFITEK